MDDDDKLLYGEESAEVSEPVEENNAPEEAQEGIDVDPTTVSYTLHFQSFFFAYTVSLIG